MRNGHGEVEQYLARKYASDLSSVGSYHSFVPADDIQDAIAMMAHYNRLRVMPVANGQEKRPEQKLFLAGAAA